MASRSKRYRSRRRLVVLLVVIGVIAAASNPTAGDFSTYVDQRYPVTALVGRNSPIALTGRRDFLFFSVYGVQTMTERHHYVGACGQFWEI